MTREEERKSQFQADVVNFRMPKMTILLSTLTGLLAMIGLLLASGCLPKPPASASGTPIMVYGFSVMQDALEKDIFPGFSAKWKKERGEDVHFVSSFAGSETITNQILHGVGAEVAILSIERDVERLREGRAITSNWQAPERRGVINRTPIVILVRRGNPKRIRDFPDLARRASS